MRDYTYSYIRSLAPKYSSEPVIYGLGTHSGDVPSPRPSNLLLAGRQAFYVRGVRVVTKIDLEDGVTSIEKMREDLYATFDAWLWFSPVVLAWRRAPICDHETEWTTGDVVVQLTARGWWDVPGEPILVALP